MHNFDNYPPRFGEPILVKIKEKIYKRTCEPHYYVVTKDTEYSFLEAGGERYARWSKDELEGWLSLDELDNILEDADLDV